MIKKAVIGDDITGAMDAGVQLLKKGLAVSVVFDAQDVSLGNMRGELIIIDTESRNIPPDNAFHKISGILENIRSSGMPLCYKKVDSTLRGNIGSEFEAVLENDDESMIAMVPALPFNGRTTLHGHQLLDGRPITENDLSKDPFSSVLSSYIPDIIQKQSAAKTGVVDIETVRKGAGAVSKALAGMKAEGTRIAVIDAESEEDLKAIREGIRQSGFKILPCGSAGFFPFVFDDSARAKADAKSEKTASPALVISGSPAQASKGQIAVAREKGATVINLNIDDITSGGRAVEKEYLRVTEAIRQSFRQGLDVVVDGAGESKEKIRNSKANIWQGSARLQDFLSRTVNAVISEFKIAGMMIIGGDTGVNIFKNMGAYSIYITGEPEPYIAAGRLEGGRYADTQVITKAGGFGSPDAVVNCIRYFKGFDR